MSMVARAPGTDNALAQIAFCFNAFSSREPVSTSLENAMEPRTTYMPIVTIQVTREGTAPGAVSVTSDEKAALIKGISQLLLDVLKKPLEATFVVIDEVDTDNWGWGGLPVREYRKKLEGSRVA
jgi:4-oxalocrotonate tautomerase